MPAGVGYFAGNGVPASSGAEIYGRRVAPTPMPNPFGSLSQVYPNLAPTNAAVSGAINSRIAGNLSPGTTDAIQNAAAEWGAASGQPGFAPGSLTGNRALRNIGLASEGQTTLGLDEYNKTIPTVSATQTVSPQLQADINSQNNVLAAAPEPTAAGSHAEELFNKYLEMTQKPVIAPLNKSIYNEASHYGRGGNVDGRMLWSGGGPSGLWT